MKDKSAWELRRSLSRKYRSKFKDELYHWFTHAAETISYRSAGTFQLLSLPEAEAIEVMMNAEQKIKGTGVPWHEFVKSRENSGRPACATERKGVAGQRRDRRSTRQSAPVGKAGRPDQPQTKEKP